MKKKKTTIIISLMIIAIFTISLLAMNEKVITTSARDSKTIGWGIKRANNNLQPDVGEANRKRKWWNMLRKRYGKIYIFNI